MQQSLAYYKELLSGFIQERITPGEVKELYAWIRQEPDLYGQLMNEPDMLALMEETAAASSAHMQASTDLRIREQLLTQETSQGRNKSVYRVIRNWWWAAAVVLLLVTGSYFLFKGQGGQAPAKQSPLLAALPVTGGNKVLLTLSDGSVIPLDSAGNKVLQQGHTTVKMLKGQLQYIAGNTQGVVAWNKLSIPRGVQYRVNLPDGSSVWLNAASTLRYPLAFTGTERRVQLTGEAYFDIAPQADQPFIVDAGNTAIQVLGTTFNINAYPEEHRLRTTLISGAISIKTAREELVLQPGKMATVTPTGSCIIATVDVNTVTAWKDGYFRFDEDDLPAVMRQLERWYDVTVKYEGNIPVRRFSGEIGRNTPLTDVLEYLQKAKVQFRKDGNVITIVNH